MKKKLAAVVACILLVATFVGCGAKVPCDICGETKSCKTTELLGQKINICSDCQAGMDALASLF